MPTILLPRQLSRFTDGQSRLTRDGDNLRTLVTNLCDEFPPLRDVMLDGRGDISPFVGVFVDALQVGDEDPAMIVLSPGSAIQLVAAVAGG